MNSDNIEKHGLDVVLLGAKPEVNGCRVTFRIIARASMRVSFVLRLITPDNPPRLLTLRDPSAGRLATHECAILDLSVEGPSVVDRLAELDGASSPPGDNIFEVTWLAAQDGYKKGDRVSLAGEVTPMSEAAS